MNLKTKDSGARRAVTGCVALVAAGVLAAACSSSSSPSTSTTAAPGTTAAPTTTVAGSTGTPTTTAGGSSTTTTTSANSSLLSTLEKLKSGEHQTFAATYKVSTTGSSDKLTSLTIAQQSPNTLFEAVTSTSTVEILTIGAKSYLCSETGGKWTCLNGGKSDPETAMFAFYEPGTYLPEVEAAVKAQGAQATYSAKTVNGFALSCISVTGAKGEKGTGTFCVTAQGVLGYVSYSSTTGGSGNFELTKYATSVPSSDFTLPATVTTLPS